MYKEVKYELLNTNFKDSELLTFNNVLRHSINCMPSYRITNVTLNTNESDFVDEQIVNRLALLPFKDKVENGLLTIKNTNIITTNDFNTESLYSDIIFLKSNEDMALDLSYNTELRQDAKSNPCCGITFEIKDRNYTIKFKILEHLANKDLVNKHIENKIIQFFAVVAEWTKA